MHWVSASNWLKQLCCMCLHLQQGASLTQLSPEHGQVWGKDRSCDQHKNVFIAVGLNLTQLTEEQLHALQYPSVLPEQWQWG